jgi:hypothetical protein
MTKDDKRLASEITGALATLASGYYSFAKNTMSPELFDIMSKMDKVEVEDDIWGNARLRVLNKRVVQQQLRAIKKLTLL